MMRGISRNLIGYKERHHVIPKCMGGLNIKENLVNLTAREHFLAHRLLTKIHPKSLGLLHVCWRMAHQTQGDLHITSRVYENLRISRSSKMSELMKGKVAFSKLAIERARQWHLDNGHSEETKRKIAIGSTGKKQSPETVAKRVAKTVGKKRTEEQCKRIRDGYMKATSNPEYTLIRRERAKKWWAIKKALLVGA